MFFRNNLRVLLSVILIMVFTIWALIFIYKSSFLVGELRYFSLFDDAMISMKYAWNLANGRGLVWSGGAPVEGYTNFLWTLIMAVVNFFFEKRHAVLIMHLLGIPTIISILWATKQLAEEIDLTEKKYSHVHTIIYLLIVVTHYPLLYWTLMGMEVGIITLMATLGMLYLVKWLKQGKPKYLLILNSILGLAYLTRPDTLYFSALFIGVYFCTEYLRKNNVIFLKRDWKYFSPLIASFTFLLVFRFFYYGELVPNTVVLKVFGHSLGLRIDNGFRYMALYLRENYIIFGVGLAALIYNPSRYKSLLLVFFFATCAYQIFVGGDPWPYWRMLAPAIPVTAIAVSAEIISIAQLLAQRLNLKKHAKKLVYTFSMIITFLIIFTQNEKFWPEILLKEQAYQAQYNEINVKYALNLKEFSMPAAQVGVFWAGSVPYYAERDGIDFLGKSDKYIAHLEPHIEPIKPKDGLIFYPGHNKYDLRYTIIKLQPDVLERADWGSESVYDDVDFNYGFVVYKGTEYLVKNNSENIKWELVTKIAK